jgi:hypothetical protein
VKAFRIIAILVAVFILVGIVESVLGLNVPPRFRRTPMFIVQRTFVPGITALLLFINPKRLKGNGEKFCYLATLFAVSVWYSAQQLRSFFLFFHTMPTWRIYGILALQWVILAVLWGTFWITTNQYLAGKSKNR